MPVPKKIDPAKQYAITIGRPVVLDADTTLLPSHDEIVVSGELLARIKDQVIDAEEHGP